MHQPVSARTVGIPGALGVLLLVVWAVGFLLFGAHANGWHVLVPAGVVLLIGQGVRRLNLGSDDPD